MTLRPVLIGASIGAALAYMLYNNSTAYAAFIDWQLAHPLVWLAFPVGVGLALLTD